MPKANITAERFEAIRALATQATQRRPNLEVLKTEYLDQYGPLSWTLQNCLRGKEVRGSLMLPNLTIFGNETVAVFSDYSGESAGRYHTYSFLVCAMNAMDHFAEQMANIRIQHGLGEKEIAFKDLHFGQMRRALPEYLQQLDNLVPGFVFTLAVEKRVKSLFGPQNKATLEFLASVVAEAGFGKRKGAIAEKLLRVVHTTAFLVALLAANGQKVFWMTDHDSIVPSPACHQDVLKLLQNVLGIYTTNKTFPLLGGALPFQERSLAFWIFLAWPIYLPVH